MKQRVSTSLSLKGTGMREIAPGLWRAIQSTTGGRPGRKERMESYPINDVRNVAKSGFSWYGKGSGTRVVATTLMWLNGLTISQSRLTVVG